MFRLADELRQPAQQFDLAVIQAARALLDGRFAEAEELIPQASRTGERSMPREATVACRLQLFILRREQGRLSEFEPIVERSIDEYPDWPFRSLHANLLAELGREAEARRVFENSAASEFGRLPRDESWLFGMSFLPEVARFLADPARAESLYELLLPCDGQYIQTGEEAGCGAVSRYLGILASTQKNWTDATRHFEDALEQNEGMGARLWIVRTQYDYGRMLRECDRPGDRTKTLELLTSAHRTGVGLGMRAVSESAELELEELGRRSPHPQPPTS